MRVRVPVAARVTVVGSGVTRRRGTYRTAALENASSRGATRGELSCCARQAERWRAPLPGSGPVRRRKRPAGAARVPVIAVVGARLAVCVGGCGCSYEWSKPARAPGVQPRGPQYRT
ncbi:hypothetical protein GCM10023082_57360 [Streptomyces tremellae]|uniref:Uncharacterized protein n=1 Tax=Streptomyces tremellae TaxID=1124239 RepID=A0ABP7G4N0_9ACTN